MMATIEKIAEVNAVVGEGPIWDIENQKLLWTDIRTGRMFQYDPVTDRYEQIHDGFFVGGYALNKSGGIVACIWDGMVMWHSDEDWVRIVDETFDGHLLRFNDITADPAGRIFGGTVLDDGLGKLYRFDGDGHIEIVEEGVGCSNGMGYSPDKKTMYHTDSAVRTIYAYDYDLKSGDISNRSVLIKLDDTQGVPDGMTVDSEGYIWTAVWFSGCIIRFDPSGVEERRISIPAFQTSSVMFGGKDLNDIYVTTADFNVDQGGPLDPADYDWAAYKSGYRGGGLFRIRQDIQGVPENKADFTWPSHRSS
jgi:D-xylono/L-arabinono-1,4-lactonase